MSSLQLVKDVQSMFGIEMEVKNNDRVPTNEEIMTNYVCSWLLRKDYREKILGLENVKKLVSMGYTVSFRNNRLITTLISNNDLESVKYLHEEMNIPLTDGDHELFACIVTDNIESEKRMGSMYYLIVTKPGERRDKRNYELARMLGHTEMEKYILNKLQKKTE